MNTELFAPLIEVLKEIAEILDRIAMPLEYLFDIIADIDTSDLDDTGGDNETVEFFDDRGTLNI